MAENAGDTNGATPIWPADVIHVNEDGWVLINRGLTQGVVVGQRLLVVGPSVRALRNIFATHGDTPAPVALQIRRTYELLEVVYAERECAVAVAARAPIQRRPEFYRGPSGELLVWVPLPTDYTWPPADDAGNDDTGDSGADDASSDASDAASDDEDDAEDSDDDSADDSGGLDGSNESAGANAQAAPDEPPEHVAQEDERWEEALPLNGVSVGDLVVPALPASPTFGGLSAVTTMPHTTSAPAPAYDVSAPLGHATSATPGSEGTGQSSDWMKPLV